MCSASKKGEKIMANIFMFQGFRYLNIDATVGQNGVNSFDDVYLIQALLFEVLTKRFNHPMFGIQGKKIPLPNGNPAGVAESLMLYKQIKNKISAKYPIGNRKVYYDKTIDPIQGSIFAYGTNHPWALVQLQGDLMDMLLITNLLDKYDTVEAYLYDKYPSLLFMFRE